MIHPLDPKKIPTVTVSLILISVIIFIGTNKGNSTNIVKYFVLSLEYGFMPEIMRGEVWRAITPIFIHFGILHILFNMLWLWDLGVTVESTFGRLWLLVLVILFGLIGNFAEYFWSGAGLSGGMSGVVYGLLGYIWIFGKRNPWKGVGLHQEIVAFMIVWYVICWLGIIGGVGNMAHTGGLLAGMLIGWIHGSWTRSLRNRR